MADNPKQPYGDVPYADPGYQKDGKKRYPLDTAAHAKAAWSYINQSDNAAQYSSGDLAKVKGKIKAACAKFGIQISEEQQQEKALHFDDECPCGSPDCTAYPVRNDGEPQLVRYARAESLREGLIRGPFPLELRRSSTGDGMPTLVGHFAVFNRWARIDSASEGQFYESIAPGAFRNTFSQNRGRMRVLFNHGQDPAIGNKVLGPIAELREDDEGAYYEVPLLDTSYNRDLLPALDKGLYGASFRFTVLKEKPNNRPNRSDYNPDGWPELTVQEAKVREFGPVTFPAYEDATAGIRSLTDDFIVMRLLGDPERLQSLVQRYSPSSALSRPGAEPAHSAVREPQPSRWPSVSREEFIGKAGTGRSPFDP